MRITSLLSLIRGIRFKTFEKGDVLIEKDSKEGDIFFIRKGLVRSYFFNENADEITFQIFAEKSFFGNIHAMMLHQSSKFTYEALEKTKVYTLPFDAFRKLMRENAEKLEVDRSFMFQSTFSQIYNRMESFVIMSPEQRYEKYVKDHPNIIHRVPDKYIASILGITPVSLSRIRGRIASKKE
jgi:CRP-like cAMP-binding protein